MTANLPLHFTKMHGLGNDFVVINALNKPLDPKTLALAELADRHIGIGFDQVLIIQPSQQANFYCRIFNSDGSEAKQCGNGLRCVARYVYDERLINTLTFTIETAAGIYSVTVKDDKHIRVSMGSPTIVNKLTTLIIPNQDKVLASILSVGNQHVIINTPNIDSDYPNRIAPYIASHSLFPDGVNIGFMQVINDQHIRLRTFERGAGETLACGSNACAATVAGNINDWLSQEVQIEYRYGSLFIEWKGEGHPIHMTGPATYVYFGSL